MTWFCGFVVIAVWRFYCFLLELVVSFGVFLFWWGIDRLLTS